MHSGVISHYRIIRKLGQGGMGEVYLADDSVLGRKVAIKVLPEDSVSDDQARRRLLREARAAATLDHPNICSIHEVGDEDGSAFIVMQYVEGQTLSERLREKPMSLKESLDIASQIASALEEAHSRGVVHRDIKPQNIIMTPRGLVKVLDFGLAKILPVETDASAEQTQSLLTDAGMVIGTAPYMSPEQAKCGPVDARSDLFSLGAVLYECVTGTPAFSGSTPMEICARVIHEDPPAPSKVNPSVPPELDRLIIKLLSKKAESRYQSASELRADLSLIGQSLTSEEQVPTHAVRADDSKSRISGLITASAIMARRPRVYIPTLLVCLVIPAFFLLRESRLWPAAAYEALPEAKRWYDLGVARMREGAYYEATKALQQAIAVDDKFAMAYAHLAEAWTELDYTDKAQKEMVHATALVPDPSRLRRADALYLQAVNLTMAGDFSSAIERFRSIVDQCGPLEVSGARMDLGRAYERNEDLNHSADSYAEATKEDSLSAAGFLRLGVIYGRMGNLKSADEQFTRAERLYQDTGNYEGVAEVLYQQGSLLNNTKNQSSAREALQTALEKTRLTDSKSQEIKILLQLSSVSSTEGNFSQAEEAATNALALARQEDVESAADDSLLELGNVSFLRGDYTSAEKRFEDALGAARKYRGRKHEARALLSLGSLAVQQASPDKAIPYLTEALSFYHSGGYRKETSQALMLLGRSYRQKGDYSAAQKIFEQQLVLSEQTGDIAQQATAHTSIGTLLSYQERYPEAITHFEDSLTIDQSRGALLDQGYDLMNRGDMLCRLGRFDEGRESLVRAESIADRAGNGSGQLQAWIHLNFARMALGQRDLAVAQAEARKALDTAGSQYKDITAHAKYTLGLSLALSGTSVAGVALCKESLSLAESIANQRIKYMALLALSECLLKTGNARDARRTATQAAEGFAQHDQEDSGWRALVLACFAASSLNDEVGAHGYLDGASGVATKQLQKWGVENYSKYLKRPDVHQYSDTLSKVISTN